VKILIERCSFKRYIVIEQRSFTLNLNHTRALHAMAKRDDELGRFVRDALATGSSHAEIENALQQAGWQDVQVTSALSAYSKVDFSVPVPAPRQFVSAGETFLYLVLFTTLFLSAYGMGSAIFGYIEQAFPDVVRSNYWTDKKIRWGISFLVVTAPIFVFAADRVRRMLIAEPTKAGSPTRKWLTYIALFVAMAFIIGDVATLVFWLLGGELTTRFILKIVTVAVIAGGVFGYYLFELKRDEQS
jgi:hypothetical protein